MNMSEKEPIVLELEDGEIHFHYESKPVFPFNGCPMMSIMKDDECASFYMEFSSNEEIDKVIEALQSIKFKE